MRILLAHNAYRSGAPSGEDFVFRNERALLESHGHEVALYERYNDDIDESGISKKIKLALSGAWSQESYNDISRKIAEFKPDIAHFHNTFPLISPSAYGACQDHDVPVVQTLHNYRLICPGALLHRNGKPCEDCVGKTLLPALVHSCYRNSLLATSALVWMLARNRWSKTYHTLVNRYIALTRFSAGRLIAGGLPSHRIMVKPNFIPSPPELGDGGGDYAAYIGRLSSEKGVHTLLEAWRNTGGFPLKIVGSGETQDDLIKYAAESDLPVQFLGFRPREEAIEIVRHAKFIVIPSECYEGFPLVALEAKAPGSWYVNVLAAFPEFRGQGIGARLLAFAEERARMHKATSASMIVASENAGAMRLYARSGYREVARAPVIEFPGCAHGGDWVLMVKPI